MKLDSDYKNGTDYFRHKFVSKVEAIFNGLPKPKEWRSFYSHDLPLLTSIDDEVQAVAVHRSNNQNRDATPGQKAMAFAMQFPEGLQRGRGNCSQIREQLTKTQENLISKARYVLRNSPMVEGDRYPRRCFPHGQFLPWIAAEFEMSRETSDNFMSVHKRFGDGKLVNFTSFKPSILYALSAPSTPESVIEKAIEQVEAGEKVTVADVKQWKEAAQVASQRAEEFRAESNERRRFSHARGRNWAQSFAQHRTGKQSLAVPVKARWRPPIHPPVRRGGCRWRRACAPVRG